MAAAWTVTEFEDEFDVDVPHDADRNVGTVGQAIDEIEKVFQCRTA